MLYECKIPAGDNNIGDSDSDDDDDADGEEIDGPADKVAAWFSDQIEEAGEADPADSSAQQDVAIDHSEEGDLGINRVTSKLDDLVEADYVLSEQDIELASRFPSRKGLLTIIEFRAFLGLWLLRGLWRQGTARLSNLFRPEALPIFSATMSRERFKWILRHLSFDGVVNTEERKARWMHDRLAAIRYMFEVVVDRWARPMVPDVYLTIDETLYNLYTQVQFKVYNKGKPQKYGVNFKSINAVQYPYTYASHVYAGKPVDLPNQFYLSGTDNYTKYLIDYLAERSVLSGRNLTMDRLYTSFEIAEWLFEKHHMTMIGTFQSNRKGFPQDLKLPGPPYSSALYYLKDGPLCLVQYSVKNKSKGNMSVVALTTRVPIEGVTKDELQKPQILKLYDFTKAGTDAMDSRFSSSSYSSKPKTRRWPVAVFSYIMDTTRVNCQTLVSLNNGKNPKEIRSFDFGHRLAMSLINPHLYSKELTGIKQTTLLKMHLATSDDRFLRHVMRVCNPEKSLIDALPYRDRDVRTGKRCGECMRAVYSSGHSSKDKRTKIHSLSTVKTRCERCGLFKCNKKHMVKLCLKCAAR